MAGGPVFFAQPCIQTGSSSCPNALSFNRPTIAIGMRVGLYMCVRRGDPWVCTAFSVTTVQEKSISKHWQPRNDDPPTTNPGYVMQVYRSIGIQ